QRRCRHLAWLDGGCIGSGAPRRCAEGGLHDRGRNQPGQPLKIRSPIVRKRTRLEIIPLIDIMFFLLASFMMVSLQMQKVRTLKASLPTATLATPARKPDIINLKVDRYGQVTVEKKAVTIPELFTLLTNRHTLNTNVPVYIHGN